MPDNILNHSTAAERSEWGRRAAANTAARHVDVDVNNITFGVEIECYLPVDFMAANGVQRGGYHRGTALSAGHGWPTFHSATWNCQGDGSLTGAPYGYQGVEIVSPVLKGKDGLASVFAMASKLQEGGAKTDSHCGLHVHIGMPSVLGGRSTDWTLVRTWVARLVGLVSKHEMALMGMGGFAARLSSSYCQTIKENWKGYHVWSKADTFERRMRADGRYRVLNLQNLFNSSRQTVEFRVFAGTVNPRKIFGYVVTALGLAERAADKPRMTHYNAENVTRDQLVALDFVALLGELSKDLKNYGWPTGAEEIVSREQAKQTQVWNCEKMHRDLQGRAH